jgi:hypothetical protein
MGSTGEVIATQPGCHEKLQPVLKLLLAGAEKKQRFKMPVILLQ